eukprot:augustus_masked-scaffold_43-processed-gene-1.8-mRNA-1 protein AED:1.00 eAED:1.00 QI:0/-1/0/0/-1/1/1/0/550
MNVVQHDITQGTELNSVRVVNDFDDEKIDAKFTYEPCLSMRDVLLEQVPASSSRIHCNCQGPCNEKTCPCALKSEYGCFAWDKDRKLRFVTPYPIRECSHLCNCSDDCVNRTSQRQFEVELEIFKTENKGFGVRSPNWIPCGTFIIGYFGELMTDSFALVETEIQDTLYGDTGNYMLTLELDEDFQRNRYKVINERELGFVGDKIWEYLDKEEDPEEIDFFTHNSGRISNKELIDSWKDFDVDKKLPKYNFPHLEELPQSISDLVEIREKIYQNLVELKQDYLLREAREDPEFYEKQLREISGSERKKYEQMLEKKVQQIKEEDAGTLERLYATFPHVPLKHFSYMESKPGEKIENERFREVLSQFAYADQLYPRVNFQIALTLDTETDEYKKNQLLMTSQSFRPNLSSALLKEYPNPPYKTSLVESLRVEVEQEKIVDLYQHKRHKSQVQQVLINPKRIGNLARFFNHSCDANMSKVNVHCDEFALFRNKDGILQKEKFNRCILVANRDIPPYIELCWNYGPGFFDKKKEGAQVFCNCNSYNCRMKQGT